MGEWQKDIPSKHSTQDFERDELVFVLVLLLLLEVFNYYIRFRLMDKDLLVGLGVREKLRLGGLRYILQLSSLLFIYPFFSIFFLIM